MLVNQSVRLLTSDCIQSLGKRCYSTNHFFSKFSITSHTNPRRAVLYVPAHEEKFLKNIPQLQVDSIVLECEDGVAGNRKEIARENAAKYLPLLVGKVYGEVCVRVNPVSSGLLEDDLKSVLGGEVLPRTIILPKVQTIQDYEYFSHIVNSEMKGRQEKINVMIMIETAVALINIRNILEEAVQSSGTPESHTRIEGVIFGCDDFAASIGAERSKEAPGMEYARQKIVAYTKAFSLQAIDKVFTEFDDPATLRRESVEAYKIGFNGKQIIHPEQIDIVQKAFTPKLARINWADELIDAFEAHSKEGKGVFKFRGQMVDMPLLRQAKNIQAIKELIDRNFER